MKSMLSSRRFGQFSDADETPDLDVTPIMNMFVILIPFLVSMAVFTHLAVLRFSLPPNAGAGLDSSNGAPRLKMTVVIAPDYIALTRGDQMLDSIAVKEERYDFAGLEKQLALRRPTLEIQDEAVVAVQDKIPFKHVVAVMDRCRDAGFEKIGLSTATADPRKGV